MKTTSKKCKEAFKGHMMKIMIQKISNDITQNFLNKNEKTMEKIKQMTFNDFIEYYTKTLDDGDFIKHINDIFFKYLNYFFDKEKNITNRSRNLFFKSDFISSIYKIYLSYKNIIKQNIYFIVGEKAKELLELQANLEIKYGNMDINNRRNFDEFKETIEIFLKRNYYFIIQNYIINFIINSCVNTGYSDCSSKHYSFSSKKYQSANNYFNNFLSEIYDKIKKSFISLGNLFDNSQYSIKIRNYLKYCLNKKLTYFSKANNLYYINEDKQEQPTDEIIFTNQINFTDDFIDEELENKFMNSGSIIFNKINKEKHYFDTKMLFSLKFKSFGNTFKYLHKELKMLMMDFVREIKLQNTSPVVFDCDDLVFNFFIQKMQENLDWYITEHLYNYFSELNNNYDLFNNNSDNKFFEKNIIKTMIHEVNILQSYKNKIHNALINNYKKYIQNFDNNFIKLENITVILTGRSGVGKSTLINCLLKERVAETGAYNVVTMATLNYNNNFLNLFDTRGYELKKDYLPNIAIENVLKKIKLNNKSKNLNEIIHFIWFCVNGSSLGDSEIEALKKLNNNEFKIPLLIVFTNAQNNDDIVSMQSQISNLFSDDIFIKVLGEPKEDIKKPFGLDDLVNKTLNIIKSNYNCNLFNIIKNPCKSEVKEFITERMDNIKQKIINKIVKEVITDYSYVKSENDFEEYLIDLIRKSLNNNYKSNYEINNIKNDKIKNYIQTNIKIYYQVTQNFIKETIDNQSLAYLDMQVCVENMKKASINPKNKKNRNGLKEFISRFLKDNFYYYAQKLLIYKFINHLENLIEFVGKIILEEIEDILKCGDIFEDYKSIYLEILKELEDKIDSFRDDDNKLFS